MPSPPANANGHRRRQVRARVLAEETHCAICGEWVDKSLTFLPGQHGPKCPGQQCPGCVPHPRRPEVDEIIPRSRGGSPYDRGNCRLTHRRCNRTKTDKPMEWAQAEVERQRAAANPVVTNLVRW